MKDRIPEILQLIKGYNIQHLIVAVNKMDIADMQIFDEIRGKITKILTNYRIKALCYVPISGKTGQGIREATDGMPTLFQALLDAKTNVMAKEKVAVTTRSELKVLLRVTGSVLITVGYSCILHIGPTVVDCEVTEMERPFLRKNEKGHVTLSVRREIALEAQRYAY